MLIKKKLSITDFTCWQLQSGTISMMTALL